MTSSRLKNRLQVSGRSVLNNSIMARFDLKLGAMNINLKHALCWHSIMLVWFESMKHVLSRYSDWLHVCRAKAQILMAIPPPRTTRSASKQTTQLDFGPPCGLHGLPPSGFHGAGSGLAGAEAGGPGARISGLRAAAFSCSLDTRLFTSQGPC